jgi:hypothetical protein
MGRHRECRRAARTHDAPTLLQRRDVVLDVLEHLAEDHRVEALVGKRERGRACADDRPVNPGREDEVGGLRDVRAHDVEPVLLEELRERALARPDVEHRPPRPAAQEEVE